MAKVTNSPASAPAATPAATNAQEPEMRDIIRKIKKTAKAVNVLKDLGMAAEAEKASKAVGVLREQAIKRFSIELDKACQIDED